jgi:hypothetical protein
MESLQGIGRRIEKIDRRGSVTFVAKRSTSEGAEWGKQSPNLSLICESEI